MMADSDTPTDVQPASVDAATEATPLRVLLVDPFEFDAQLIGSRLLRGGVPCHLRRVETAPEFQAALNEPVDLVLSETELPQFSAALALQSLQRSAPDIPLVIVTESSEEGEAVELLRRGALDYVLKDRLGRLCQSVRLAVERARMLRRLDVKRREMEHLSLRLVQAEELERRRLARELHDELGQRLTALNLQVHRLQPHADAALHAVWCDARQGVADMVAQVRTMSVNLRPPELDHLGLQAAIGHLLQRRFEGVWAHRVFEYVGLPQRLSPLLEITCYRIVQESLTNIARHARASNVVVEMIGGADELDIIVRDNGAGFEPTQWHQRMARDPRGGIVGMRERAHLLGGTLTIDSRPGRGTRVAATLPLTLEEQDEYRSGG
ncbi:hybrid sensor histidine kinase/response regulator [Pseudoduganella armeniaca]|nr:ATP-binding protein [Pseudoduganella armeniaca]